MAKAKSPTKKTSRKKSAEKSIKAEKTLEETMDDFGKNIEEMGEKIGKEIEKNIEAKIEGPARKFGYFVAIIVNIVMLYVVHHLTKWDFAILDFIQDDFDKYLWAIDVSLAVSIIGNAIFMLYDEKLFKAFMQAIINFFSIIFLSVMFIYFPFDFRELIDVGWINPVVRFAHLVFILLIIIGTIAEIVKAMIQCSKEGCK